MKNSAVWYEIFPHRSWNKPEWKREMRGNLLSIQYWKFCYLLKLLFIRNGIDQKECERDQKQQKNWGKIQLYFMKFLRIRLEIDQTKLMREMPCSSKFKWGGGGNSPVCYEILLIRHGIHQKFKVLFQKENNNRQSCGKFHFMLWNTYSSDTE